ncbi:7TM domain-containing protein [Amycolatopsis xylanica]|uniref:7TM domain-containing protein n=1 Tax=Amycolatopsis xylanica TaxID=589385 RepID=UPI00115FCB53|nr:7TM domain-containing protein [Amycolatopsis xylanica]
MVAIAAGAAILLLAALLSPSRNVTGANVVGDQEMVQLAGPAGTTIQVKAIIDTGASASAMDTRLARSLGFDLDAAPRITVGSSLGKQQRPVVDTTIKLAGTERTAKISVTDRSRRDAPVLIGRSEMAGLQVHVGKQMLTTPEGSAAPSSVAVLLTPSPSIDVESLLALLPLAALLVVIARVWIGLNTLGTFSPVLLALGYTQTGVIAGLITTTAMVTVGLAAQAVLQRTQLPRVARLAVLVGVVVLVLLGIRQAIGGAHAAVLVGASLPVVVTAVIIERLWEQWDTDGWRPAATSGLLTIAFGLVAAMLMVTPGVRWLGENVPMAFAAACCVWAFVAGTYRGLRLTELLRFTPAARAG